jgi:hypothetical protein
MSAPCVLGAHCSSGRRSLVRATATYGPGRAGHGAMAGWRDKTVRDCVCVCLGIPLKLARSCQTCAARPLLQFRQLSCSRVCAEFGLIFVCFLLKLQGRGSAAAGIPLVLELPNYLAVELPCSAWIIDGLVSRRSSRSVRKVEAVEPDTTTTTSSCLMKWHVTVSRTLHDNHVTGTQKPRALECNFC